MKYVAALVVALFVSSAHADELVVLNFSGGRQTYEREACYVHVVRSYTVVLSRPLDADEVHQFHEDFRAAIQPIIHSRPKSGYRVSSMGVDNVRYVTVIEWFMLNE